MPITKASFAGGGIEYRQGGDDEAEEQSNFTSQTLMDRLDQRTEARKTGDTVTIKGKSGKSPIKFKEGGLHQSLNVPAGEKIPASKMAAAKAGKYGALAKKQANFAGGLAKMRPGGSRAAISGAPDTLPSGKTMAGGTTDMPADMGNYPGYDEGPKPATSARADVPAGVSKMPPSMQKKAMAMKAKAQSRQLTEAGSGGVLIPKVRLASNKRRPGRQGGS